MTCEASQLIMTCEASGLLMTCESSQLIITCEASGLILTCGKSGKIMTCGVDGLIMYFRCARLRKWGSNNGKLFVVKPILVREMVTGQAGGGREEDNV